MKKYLNTNLLLIDYSNVKNTHVSKALLSFMYKMQYCLSHYSAIVQRIKAFINKFE